MDNHAFTLLAIIAYRAKRTNDFSVKNLHIGECLLGDFRSYGMSEQQYRSAKSRLQKYGFATFRATGKGTIATLSNTIIYDINEEDINGQVNTPTTDEQRTSNGQATTIKNDKNVKNGKNEKITTNSEKLTLLNTFDEARKTFQGRKQGNSIEFENFRRKHKNWREIIPLLKPAIELEIAYHEKATAAGKFCPEYKNFRTWINQSCWTGEYPEVDTRTPAQMAFDRVKNG